MLKPYIVEKPTLRLVGRSVKSEAEIGSLFDQMYDIFENIDHPVDDRFYGISMNFVNSSPDSAKTYWLCKEVKRLIDQNGDWIRLKSGMEALIIPASRWLCIPVRYDDAAVASLAPEEHREDPGYLTVCVYAWARNWLKQNGYREQDFPYELEIYSLEHENEFGTHVILALPIV